MTVLVRELTAQERDALSVCCVQEGCPTKPQNLVMLEVPLTDFSGLVFLGKLHVHRSLALDMVQVFQVIKKCKYPVSRMQTMDALGEMTIFL